MHPTPCDPAPADRAGPLLGVRHPCSPHPAWLLGDKVSWPALVLPGPALPSPSALPPRRLAAPGPPCTPAWGERRPPWRQAPLAPSLGPGHMRGFLLALCSVTPPRASPASCGAQTPATAARGVPCAAAPTRGLAGHPSQSWTRRRAPRAPTPAAREPAWSPPGSRASRPPRPGLHGAEALPHSPAQPCLAPGGGTGRAPGCPAAGRPADPGLHVGSRPPAHPGAPRLWGVPRPPGPSAHTRNDSSHFCSLFSLCSAAPCSAPIKRRVSLSRAQGGGTVGGHLGGAWGAPGGRRGAKALGGGTGLCSGRAAGAQGLLGLGCLRSPDTLQQEEGQQEEPRAGGEAGLGPGQPVR